MSDFVSDTLSEHKSCKQVKIGDKRTKLCKRCFNTSQFVCFKCRQAKLGGDEK